MRCMTLAEELQRRGHDCILLTHSSSLDIFPHLTDRGVEIQFTAELSSFPESEAKGLDADIFVVDNYDFQAAVETSLRSFAPIVAFDDAPGRQHDCDLLLDPTFGRRPADYRPFVPEGAQVVCGPAYALIRPAFAQLRPTSIMRTVADHLRRISVCFGATNVRGYSETIALALAEQFPEATIDMIVGSAVKLSDESEKTLNARSNIVRHVDPVNLPEILARSDLAIGSAGTMSWERCCLALPSVAVPLVANQLEIAAALSITESASVIDDGEKNVVGAVISAATQLAREPLRRERMAACAAALCDGRGVSRLAARIEALATEGQGARAGINLRPATEADSQAVWTWRNDFQTRRLSETTAPVTWREHSAWYSRSLENLDRLIFIAEAQDMAETFGVVRFDRTDEQTAIVSINLAPYSRGLGLGSHVLKSSCALAFSAWPIGRITAKVHRDNAASERLFLNTGFKPSGPAGDFNRLELARPGFGG